MVIYSELLIVRFNGIGGVNQNISTFYVISPHSLQFQILYSIINISAYIRLVPNYRGGEAKA